MDPDSVTDDYASMNDDYQITVNNSTNTFFSWKEIKKGSIGMKKEEQNFEDQQTGTKEIRNNRKYDQEYKRDFQRNQNDTRNINNKDMKDNSRIQSLCPICDDPGRGLNGNFSCKSGHSWHLENGRIRNGHRDMKIR